MSHCLRRFCFALLLSFVITGHADDKPVTDQVSFQVGVDREIENDLIQATLMVYDENPDPARLADQINTSMRWGLDLARRETAVRSQTGNYQTYPVYDDKRKILRWRGQQALILEASDVSAVSALAGKLQSRLQMQSMRFSVAPETRRAAQDGLIEEALQAFQQRAELITKSLGARGYEVMTVSVQTSGQDSMPPVRMDHMRAASVARVEAPALEAGTSRIRVQANGSIHLLR